MRGASDKNALELQALVAQLDPAAFEPIIKRASEDFYERIMHSCEDYLRENVEFNVSSHLQMLERENREMRAQLYAVDLALRCPNGGQEARLSEIATLQGRYSSISAEAWRLRKLVEAPARTEVPDA
ncbi:hypothetical protein HNO88_000279 [Novosphingobium chloroacetimidivorans]|uniref:Uncharacterized protein n=1 Tax=Novosphingobium chloroacetimidivorans TaxID=1428314 RepID=A0A7W7K659_9SPHN|nr:hypothetical protein [Novosphingobium chloroacetimidivorans]MBB4856982.1 hypothetical protein [Novosphingobium chloroacetimidivorans]